MHPILLASGSPRRLALLEGAGLTVSVRIPRVSEAPLPGESAEALVLRLARAKAASVGGEEGTVVVAADTVVRHRGAIIGKPGDPEEARRILRHLSGDTHEVLSGFCVRAGGAERSGRVVSEVTFRVLSLPEVDAYVATGEPLDKAGAYAIQGAGAALVDRVAGSFTNVVGLPLSEVLGAIQELSHGLRDDPRRRRAN